MCYRHSFNHLKTQQRLNGNTMSDILYLYNTLSDITVLHQIAETNDLDGSIVQVINAVHDSVQIIIEILKTCTDL